MDNLKVVILLATYNGEQYLAEQLNSFLNQDFQNLFLLISDDGSTDKTLDIIEDFRLRFGENRIFLFKGPKQGFAKNFLHLLDCAKQQFEIDESYYFAYADQDDIWYQDKLSSALKELTFLDYSKPLLYCTRTRLINEQGAEIGFAPLFSKPPSFKNALIQNIAGGNTMVFNDKTFELIQKTPKDSSIVSHDWWTYLLVTGAEGEVIYSPIPSMDYRQHAKNLIGSNMGFLARLFRMKELLKGRFMHWNSKNINALKAYEHALSASNQKIMHEFALLRENHFPKNIMKFKRLGLYRQTKFDNLAMQLALIFKRV